MMRLYIRGELQYWSFDVYTIWSLQWWEPRDKCSVLNACGNFGSCNLYNKLACKCLPGFKPKSPENWNSGDFSGGCIRSSDECGKTDTFLSLKMMREMPLQFKLSTGLHSSNCTEAEDSASCTKLQSSIKHQSLHMHFDEKEGQKASQENAERNAALLNGTEKRVKNLKDAEEFKEEDKKGIDTGSLYYTRMVKEEWEDVRFSIDLESSPGKQTEDRTQRGVGTRGYTSPEYALDGVFSIKGDVFSFGMEVVERGKGDSLTRNSPIRDSRGETIVSNGEKFELGFFTPNGSTERRYVGIWFYKSSPRTVVWVANRDNPLLDHSGVFSVDENGNLEILDGRGRSFWSINLEKPSSMNRIAKLMDTGNLVVSDEDDEKHLTGILWQSFENPTETFLPGMKLDEDMALISWKSYDDPASGNFSFQLDREANQFVIWKRSIRYWRSGVSDNGGSSRSEMPSAISYFLSNFTSTSVRNDSVPYITTSLYTNTRMVMSFAGQIQYLQLNTEKTWSVIWAQPRTRCSLYNACGNFGSCNSNNEVVCKCLPGFQPVSPEYWNSGDNSRGCARISPLCSNSATSDTFLSLKMMKVANPDAQFKANSEVECKMECLNNCQCEAFSYEEAETTKGGESESATCWIWTDDLRDIQEEYDGGRDLHVRVSVSDTGHWAMAALTPYDIMSDSKNTTNLTVTLTSVSAESAAATCGTCGTNMIPYPLSTGPKCGDPAYLNFYCNLSSGQLNFKARGDTYRVTKINPGTHTFVIQTETADSCKSIKSNGNLLQLNQSSPFHVIRFCNVDLGNISSAISFTGGDEVEIGWDPPPEPTCFSSSDCKYWPNSSCSARIDGNKLCLCNAKFKWDGLKLKCTEGHYSEKKDSSSIGKIPLSLIIAVALISLIALAVLSSTIVCICLQRRRMPKLRDRKLCVSLDWEMRYNIIVGIARGLLYLHQDSRLRIIHRDLKSSNILLDEEMNPKISDFGLARIFGGNETAANTNRVVGTYGYIAPEYALDGLFSFKSDVFSFGVVVLEIVSGKRNTGCYHPEQSLSLLGHAWNLWKEDKAMKLLDQTLSKTCKTDEYVKCVNVGLLCVQEDPSDRPTVSNILFMLGSETPTLPDPKQPAFVFRRCPSSRASSSSKPDTVSNNGLTVTLEDGR
ncbi:hypothetical protein POTOM_045892 [Populus tomentosa]|uniref:non-specific serine/threonine protein kinase n=1 Tax=Populus tomentosa TaxID=118781 RepID=A0A8X7YE05_POPTO|nr:hypothetical protein POTOM_045892 [Populus tomentosa]